MAENHDFLAEFNELRAETDEIRKTLVSKTTQNRLLEEIAMEMRLIRREIKENQEKNEQKFEELKMENEKKMKEYKSEVLEEIRKVSEHQNGILEELKKNRKLQGQKMHKLSKEPAKCVSKIIPIREAILGEWRMVDHENFEGFEADYEISFEEFSANVKYEMENGKLKEIVAGFDELVEGAEETDDCDELHEEDNHLKTIWCGIETIDRYIKDGKLYIFEDSFETVWHRVYVKV